MSQLEPEDQLEVACTECGEEEQVKPIAGALWECLICQDTFSDGSDRDDDFVY
jgi:ribosomal protein L37AE/L43A